MKATQNKMGFTLLELLIVILIIGLLSAISIPMYKKAVEKSKVADALSTMQAVSKSEHGWYLVKNNYTKDFANLDIDLYDKDGNKADNDTLEGINYTYELLDTGILASRNNGEYTIYQDYETKQIMCTPGTHFICDNLGAFTKEPCEKTGMAWANTNSTCYANEEARCKGLHGEDTWNGEFCGYTNTKGQTIGEGMECKCKGMTRACEGSIIEDGGKCIGMNVEGCSGSTINKGGICEGQACQDLLINGGECSAISNQGCIRSTVTAGGICSGSCFGVTVYDGGNCTGSCLTSIINDGGICSGNCSYSTINDGGICKSSSTNACKNNTYTGTGCCCGDYCGSKPKCADSVCANI